MNLIVSKGATLSIAAGASLHVGPDASVTLGASGALIVESGANVSVIGALVIANNSQTCHVPACERSAPADASQVCEKEATNDIEASKPREYGFAEAIEEAESAILFWVLGLTAAFGVTAGSAKLVSDLFPGHLPLRVGVALSCGLGVLAACTFLTLHASFVRRWEQALERVLRFSEVPSKATLTSALVYLSGCLLTNVGAEVGAKWLESLEHSGVAVVIGLVLFNFMFKRLKRRATFP